MNHEVGSQLELFSLISHLADGQFHSGSDLGKQFGVSRTAIWKALSQLSEYGLVVESHKGKGYRLESPIELLDLESVEARLDDGVEDRASVEILPKVASTNTQIVDLPSDDLRPFSFLFAEMQTAGRGRRGRSWISPFGCNLYFSVMFDLKGGPEALSGLSLVVGLSVVRALARFSDESFSLKWPNDVLWQDKKVAGVLVELQGEATTGWRVVVGIGLNFSMAGDIEQIDQPWASIGELCDCGRNELAAALVSQLVNDLSIYIKEGFSAFRTSWMDFDYFKEKAVEVLGADLFGKAVGIDAMGNLLVESEGIVQVINAGEVSVRRS